MGGLAEYHDGGLRRPITPAAGVPTNIEPGGRVLGPQRGRGRPHLVGLRLRGPDAGFFIVNLSGDRRSGRSSRRRTPRRRGDLAVDTSADRHRPPTASSATRTTTDFVFERFEDHFLPVDHPVTVSPLRPQQTPDGSWCGPRFSRGSPAWRPARSTWCPNLGPDIVEPYPGRPRLHRPVPGRCRRRSTVQNVFPNLWTPRPWTDGSPNPFLDLRVRQAGEPRDQPPGPDRQPPARPVGELVPSSHSTASRATRPRSSGRKSSTTTTPNWRGS